MKVEKLSKGNKRKIIIAITIIVLLVGIIYITNSRAKYQVTQSVQIVNGNVSYSPYDFKIIAMYKNDGGEDTPITEMPGSEYAIDETKSYCMRGNEQIRGLLKTINGYHTISKLHTNDKCYLWFKPKPLTIQDIIASKTTIAGETGGFGNVETADHSNILYTDTDDFGKTYYFRGKVKDNWVKFGKNKSGQDLYWRIIRINGDGTIRLIYAGEGSAATSDGGYTTSGTDALINQDTNVKYYDSYERAEYVGFEFKTGEVHGYGTGATKSNVLMVLNTWFNNNLSDEFANGTGNIDKNAGFCNDRRNSTTNTTVWGNENDNGGTGTATTYYGAWLRLIPGGNNPSPTNKAKPTFICKSINNDYFTYTGAEGIRTTSQTNVMGTRSLTWPVGLITADEVAYAGGLQGQNNLDYY